MRGGETRGQGNRETGRQGDRRTGILQLFCSGSQDGLSVEIDEVNERLRQRLAQSWRALSPLQGCAAALDHPALRAGLSTWALSAREQGGSWEFVVCGFAIEWIRAG